MLKTKQCCVKKTSQPQKTLDVLAKALAHPIRLQILALLKTKKNCICGEIVNELPLAQATVSQHLKVLKEACFIRGTIDGPKTCYCLEPQTIKQLKQLVKKF